jgi:hypothetical protein
LAPPLRHAGSVQREKGVTMPRFHFEAQGSERLADPEGVELRNLAAARLEAARLAAALVRDYPEVFAEPRSWRMCILDDDGNTLEAQSFDAFDLKPNANDD